jgi:peptidoglycan/LPS O-acetylase OafA/YrhL
MTDNKQRLQEFEALRALSIILLLILHSDVFSLQVFGIELGPISHFVGAFLLGSFFFLAGYFQEVSMQKRGQNPLSYVKSKFVRIFPPYWLALAMFVFIMGYSLKRFELSVYLSNLQFIFSPAFAKQLLTLWYISVVVGYYIIFGILEYHTKSNMALFVWSVILFGAAYVLHKTTSLLDGRFFEYYFIFLAGIYFSRFQQVRERLFDLNFIYKIVIALLGVWLFRLALAAGYEITNGFYLLAVNFYILGWVLMWLGIFRTGAGRWRIWSPVSTASFFAYLYHRPIWYILIPLLAGRMGLSSIMFQFIPGSILVVCYFLQKGYDALLHINRSFGNSKAGRI